MPSSQHCRQDGSSNTLNRQIGSSVNSRNKAFFVTFLSLRKNTMIKATSRRKHLFGLWLQRVRVCLNRELRCQARSRKLKQGWGMGQEEWCKALKTQSPFPVPHVFQQSLASYPSPNSSTNWGPSVQIREPIGVVFIQTTQKAEKPGSFPHSTPQDLTNEWVDSQTVPRGEDSRTCLPP